MDDVQVIEFALSRMAEKGIVPFDENDIRADGALHRFRCRDDRPATKNGWYVIHADENPAGQFGCNKRYGSERFGWSMTRKELLTRAERQRLARLRAEGEKLRTRRREAEESEAARVAADCWRQGQHGDHRYLVAKQIAGVSSRVGITPSGQPGVLMVPIRNLRGRLTSLQFINENRQKWFLPGGKIKGCGCVFGERTQKVILCEGYATAHSLYDLFGLRTIAALTASNLVDVARALHQYNPKLEIHIFADNDRFTTQPMPNPGVHYAQLAAAECGGKVFIPQFPDECQDLTDWNDLLIYRGADHITGMNFFD